MVDVQAGQGGHVDTVRLLLDHGANVPVPLAFSPAVDQAVKELLRKQLTEYVFSCFYTYVVALCECVVLVT